MWLLDHITVDYVGVIVSAGELRKSGASGYSFPYDTLADKNLLSTKRNKLLRPAVI